MTLYVCYYDYGRYEGVSLPIRIFDRLIEAEEWVKDNILHDDEWPEYEPKYVEIELG